jgi:transcription initiation factor TFIIH subunit 4
VLAILHNFRDFGLIWMRKKKKKITKKYKYIIYISPVFKEFLNIGTRTEDQEVDSHYDEKRFIIVETNFRVLAYTESEFHIALLGKFRLNIINL